MTQTHVENWEDKLVRARQETGAIGVFEGLSIPQHDAITLVYTGDNPTTIQYRVGGKTGTIVATVTLEYSGDNVISVELT